MAATDGSVLEKEDLKTISEEPGDHDRFAHYFNKDDIDRAWFDGAEIEAICGKKDIPTRTVDGRTVCPTCKEIYEVMKP